jgi:hypothetical protein
MGVTTAIPARSRQIGFRRRRAMASLAVNQQSADRIQNAPPNEVRSMLEFMPGAGSIAADASCVA